MATKSSKRKEISSQKVQTGTHKDEFIKELAKLESRISEQQNIINLLHQRIIRRDEIIKKLELELSKKTDSQERLQEISTFLINSLILITVSSTIIIYLFGTFRT